MQSFSELQKIQPIVVPLLLRSIEKKRLAHAYLFEGGRGTGKKRVALQLVKSFFCTKKQKAEPCQTCTNCLRIERGNHPNYHFISPDGASIRREHMDYLQKEFAYRGLEQSKKAYIIEHADMMTITAANSLLKILEEPPAFTLIILLTERGQSVIPTIQSRTQQIVFAPLSKKRLFQKLEADEVSPSISRLLCALTTSYEEATQFVEGGWIAQARTVVIQLMKELYDRPTYTFFIVQEKWITLFKERWQQEIGLEMILLWLKDILYMKNNELDSIVFLDQKDILKQQVQYSQTQLTKHMLAVLEARKHLVANVNPQLFMEKLLLTIQEG